MHSWTIRCLVLSVLAFCCSCQAELPEEIASVQASLPDVVDFNFHIRPILSDRCFSCHGPDENARKASLRLDIEAAAFEKLESGKGYAIKKCQPHKSALIKRILSDDPDYQMPTPESNLVLSDYEKALLHKWIDQGAQWKKHWAFISPQSPRVPDLKIDWETKHPIDHFVAAKISTQDLLPNPAAPKEILLRRVAMDLTGLPPTLEEIDDFLADNSPQAFEKVVDRLLASPAYAERMAMDWMDIARYADSHGMHADGYREMWQWRDWVIQAYQENMPYDQFVKWQLAGDLMPKASLAQKLATAFNRNHPMTAEGGVIEEEFRLGYVFDRAETMSTAFMGMTLACAKCHDHKFDPISQKEYYQTAAFFNNVKELGMTGDDGNYGPMLPLPDEASQQKIEALQASITAKSDALSAMEVEAIKQYMQAPKPLNALVGQSLKVTFDSKQPMTKDPSRFYLDSNKKISTRSKTDLVAGKKGMAFQFTGDYDEIYIEDAGLIELYEPISVGLWINSDTHDEGKTQVLVGNAGNKNNFWRGWDFYLDEQRHLCVRLIHSLPHNYIHLRSTQTIPIQAWQHLAFSYDGSAMAKGITIYINGEKVATTTEFDQLYKTIYPVRTGSHVKVDQALLVGKSYRAFTGENGLFKGLMDELQLFDRALLPNEMRLLAGQELALTKADYAQIAYQMSSAHQEELAKINQLRMERLDIMNTIPEVMVMEEMSKERPMFVLDRGEYDSPKEEVQAATPASILPFPADQPKNRLALAEWLFDEKHPLTARVAVNRYWQMLFGQGLVKTPQDFGVQGALPSHPALLDWLAVQYQESAWDTKALIKTIVMSATYQQSSIRSQEKQEIDPENVYLSYGPSYRLSAEMIRDNALAASGLLVDQVGGPSVKPYQPDGLWIELGNFSHQLLTYQQNKGDSLYRRSLYTFIRRTSPPPAMTVFDAPNRDVCTVQRERTNTPLQALVLLNDPQFVEAARVLAQRLMVKHPNQLDQQIEDAFRAVTSRFPNEQERALFQELYEEQKTHYQTQPQAAKALLQVGEYPTEKGLDPIGSAALAMVTSTMFNHDEAYMKR